MGLARIRPAAESGIDVPAGLEGVVVAETTVGDVRGQEGFFHYRQYSAVDLAEQRSLEDVWHLLFKGELPDAAASASFASRCGLADLPPGLAALLPALAPRAPRSMCCAAPSRSSVPSSAGARPTTSAPRSSTTRRSGSARSCRPFWRPPTGCGRAARWWQPRADLDSPPTTCTCSPAQGRARRMPGRSSST